MRSAAELKALRAQTKAFIAANPVEITLTPRTRVKSGTGVTFDDQPERAPQVLCLIDQSTSSSPTPGVIPTADGRERRVDWILLGETGAEVALYDKWTDASGTWEVVQVFPDNGYEVRAAVSRHA